ncbi:aldehyde dehydrogenase [Cryphonectria parasitica EP155]|uniref:Aldehyde dehydrogenase n=1 Tax=Cryphonectria parasitica (strain ATCC 38755 / EP155) TaxID=660469 RepID=A0A9P4XW19_CRYP1|nr:aldehyde dehydrogenase [Cryphonectria parasitica EP155]KAF3761956.1 aldehyde dehydrogenase [Cryphonectria parasitica EP155]
MVTLDLDQPSHSSSALDALWAANTPEKATALLENLNGKPSSRYIDSFEPKTGKLIARVPCASADEVDAAVSAARAAFPAWSKTPRAERSRLLRRVSEIIAENRELFAVWESLDQGKTLERARVEVDRAVSNFAYFSTFILHESTSARMVDGVALTYEHRSPAGVFVLISPWNMPLYLLTWKIAPCLAFGCTAVAKPSEVTSMSAFLLASALGRAGLPAGVINVLFGDGATTGAALVAHRDVQGVSFTGGTATGIAIRRATAHQIHKHVSLELGGKNPTLVFADAMTATTREKTVRTAAMAAFENQGEICLCGSRIYVERSVYEDFVAGFTEYVTRQYRVGETVGAVVSLQHYAKIRGYLEIAQKQGMTFNTGEVPPEIQTGSGEGGEQQKGYWIQPTVLTGVPAGSELLRDEIFGPVVTIVPFDDEEEAVRLANDSEYGLAAVLLTTDGGRMRRVGEQLQAGLVWVNCWLVRELGTPFGGMKNSGTGREGGEYSRDVFTVARTVHLATV